MWCGLCLHCGVINWLQVLLWQPLTGGRVHVSVSAPDGVHHSTVCGRELASYVCYRTPKRWVDVLSCKECRQRLRFLWPSAGPFVTKEDTFGPLFEWRERQAQKLRA